MRLAYDALQEKYEDIDASATQETVKKKINSLHSIYGKEFLKIEESVRSGAGTDELYTPFLRYYYLLSFLNDQEIPRVSAII